MIMIRQNNDYNNFRKKNEQKFALFVQIIISVHGLAFHKWFYSEISSIKKRYLLFFFFLNLIVIK